VTSALYSMQGTRCGCTLPSFRHGVLLRSRPAYYCTALPDFSLQQCRGVKSRIIYSSKSDSSQNLLLRQIPSSLPSKPCARSTHSFGQDMFVH
jgi:hypothetical protein